MTRVAVICLGYLGNPEGVRRLVQYMAAAQARLYLHIDARVSIEPYRAALGGVEGATLIAERRAIHWGGFSLVETVIDALYTARGDHDYDRYCLLTEDSVPLLAAHRFRALMAAQDEYIQLYSNLPQAVWRRYQGFYYFDCAATNPRSEPADREVTQGLSDALARLEALRARGKLAIERLYHGATWWALSARAIDEILIQWAESPHLRHSFEFSMIPEEQYFHTILGNAAYRFSARPFMFADFERDPRPYVYRTRAELEALRNLPYLFARKGALDSAEVSAFVAALSTPR